MHWGRFCAAAAILALTLLTFASCGPLEFKGTNLLMNKIDTGDIASGMGAMMGDAKPAKPTEPAESETLFEGGDQWLHFLYIAMLAIAVIGLAVKPKLFAVVGILGIALTVVFMIGFNSSFKKKGSDGKGGGDDPFTKGLSASVSLDWKEGAWIALAGFAGLAIAGFQEQKKAKGGSG